jgi:hypothetical protein
MAHPIGDRFNALALWTACILLALACAAAPARAQVTISHGSYVTLGGSDPGSAADGGGVSCAIAGLGVSCLLPEYLFSTANPGDNFVRARHNRNSGSGLAEPHVATARIYDDFRIPGPPDSFVPVLFSVTYDLYLSLVGSAAYECSGELSLIVEDVTDATPIAVGSASLFRQDRSGDQGFTDITTGREVYQKSGEAGSLSLLLRRGRTYRVWFQVEVMGEQFVVGNTDNLVEATRRRLVVSVDEDEVEQLDRIEAKIDAIAAQIALIQRTQLEKALVTHSESRLTVLHTDRLEEVCDAAQQAIDASTDLGYVVKQTVQGLVEKARALMQSDPKRAVALCRDAYRRAAFGTRLK